MSLKDIWKDKVDGVDDVLAEDINAIANEVIRLDNETEDNLNKTKLRDERLKYYGDPDIVPSDKKYFSFVIDSTTRTASVVLKYTTGQINTLVIPYKYIVNDVTYTITKIETPDTFFTFRPKKIILPNTITEIGRDAFSGLTSVTGIAIPDSVTSIGEYAFSGCSGLKFVNLSSSLTSIGDGAFSYTDTELTIVCAEGSYADQYAQENNINVEYTNEVTKNYVDQRIGEIETALDGIIGIQNELIGGGVV